MKPANYAPVYAAALYPEWSEIAREHGYALAVHGSCARDFDLICIPWIDRPAAPEVVLEAITSKFAAKLIGGPTTTKPHGRIAYTLSIGFGECAVDMQFMPRRDAEHVCHGLGGAHRCGDSRCWAKRCAATLGVRAPDAQTSPPPHADADPMPSDRLSKEKNVSERTPKDYAIEHAGYMADAVKHFLSCLDAEFDANEALEAAEAADAEDAKDKAADLRSIEEEVSEARTVLRNRVYEFEKRRDRAVASCDAPTHPESQPK